MNRYLDKRIIDYISCHPHKEDITEIRLRAEKPVQFTVNGKTDTADIVVSQQQLDDIFYNICNRSINVYENDIAQGFVTLDDASRVGIGGEFYYNAVLNKYLLKKLDSLNIRRAKDVTYFENQHRLFEKVPDNTLIAGKPHSGKTSLLKLYAKYLAQDYRLVICDERKEMKTDNINCDIIQGIKKADGIMMATRTLNPQFIICDEIGDMAESHNILSAINTGVKFICTAHGESIEQVLKRPPIKLLADSGIFRRFVLVGQHKNSFAVECVYDV
ncbi:MAG: Flp pilus assembly complex ATPase component TadA [Oscillospiraceae bacterium]|nr:Flp pilus assembly complex ATPase component TadA [Oscillospiraceae bacterium]